MHTPPFLQLAENCREVLLSSWKSDKFIHLYDFLIEMCGDYPWDFLHVTGTEIPPNQPPFGSQSSMNCTKIKELSTKKASTTKAGFENKFCFATSAKFKHFFVFPLNTPHQYPSFLTEKQMPL